MKTNEKWGLFKQYLHNELGITKEDIREWVQEAVREEAKRLVDNEFNNFNVAEVIKKMLMSDTYDRNAWGRLRTDITKSISEEVLKGLNITVERKKEA